MGLFPWLHHRFMVPRAYHLNVVQHRVIMSPERLAPFLCTSVGFEFARFRAAAVLMEASVLRELPALRPADVSVPGVCVQISACRLARNVNGVGLAEEVRLVGPLLLPPPMDLLHGVSSRTVTMSDESWIAFWWLDCNLMR